jgi:hypothetical protein
MPNLKQTIADAAIKGATAEVERQLSTTHEVELHRHDRLSATWRVTLRKTPEVGGQPWPTGPRYFTVRVSESI